MISAHRKKILFTCIFGCCVVLPLSIVFGYKVFQTQEQSIFAPEVAIVKEIKIPFDITNLYFEKNNGISDRKAEKTMISIDDIAKNNRYEGITNEESEQLQSAISSYIVNFTNVKHLGLICAFANWLNGIKKLVDYYRLIEPDTIINENAQRFVKVIKELACHIYIQKKEGNISLQEYNDAYYGDQYSNNKYEDINSLNGGIAANVQQEYEALMPHLQIDKHMLNEFVGLKNYIYRDNFAHSMIMLLSEDAKFSNKGLRTSRDIKNDKLHLQSINKLPLEKTKSKNEKILPQIHSENVENDEAKKKEKEQAADQAKKIEAQKPKMIEEQKLKMIEEQNLKMIEEQKLKMIEEQKLKAAADQVKKIEEQKLKAAADQAKKIEEQKVKTAADQAKKIEEQKLKNATDQAKKMEEQGFNNALGQAINIADQMKKIDEARFKAEMGADDARFEARFKAVAERMRPKMDAKTEYQQKMKLAKAALIKAEQAIKIDAERLQTGLNTEPKQKRKSLTQDAFIEVDKNIYLEQVRTSINVLKQLHKIHEAYKPTDISSKEHENSNTQLSEALSSITSLKSLVIDAKNHPDATLNNYVIPSSNESVLEEAKLISVCYENEDIVSEYVCVIMTNNGLSALIKLQKDWIDRNRLQ